MIRGADGEAVIHLIPGHSLTCIHYSWQQQWVSATWKCGSVFVEANKCIKYQKHFCFTVYSFVFMVFLLLLPDNTYCGVKGCVRPILSDNPPSGLNVMHVTTVPATILANAT